jgi:hypothetical protein
MTLRGAQDARMRRTAPPWPARVSDRLLLALLVLGTLGFLVLAAMNPIAPDHLLRMQLAGTPARWNAVLADGATLEALRSHLVQDVAGMIPGYTVALTALFTLRWRRAVAGGASEARRRALLRSAWLPLAVAAVDLVENAGMWTASGAAEPAAGLIAATTVAAAVKWALVLATLLGPAVAALRDR